MDPNATRNERHPLDTLTLIPELQVRVRCDTETIRDYAAAMAVAPDDFPPVDVFDVEGKLYLVHGWHRYNAARIAKQESIRCRVIEGTMEEAWQFAWGANRTNGRRLTTKDKRHAIEVALTRHPEWASARIAEMIGCTHPTVERYRKNLPIGPAGADAVRIGSDNKRRKVRANDTSKVLPELQPVQEASSPEVTLLADDVEGTRNIKQTVTELRKVMAIFMEATDEEKLQIQRIIGECLILVFMVAEFSK